MSLKKLTFPSSVEVSDQIRVFMLAEGTLKESTAVGGHMGGDDSAVVRTYVPPEQKSEWRAHADELDMSQSEYLRTMVQAGRRGFLADHEEGGSGGVNPGGSALEDRVLDVVDSSGVASWDELVAALSEDFENRVEDAVQELSDRGEIRYDPRQDGYVRQKDE
jgi:hypothetical protein